MLVNSCSGPTWTDDRNVITLRAERLLLQVLMASQAVLVDIPKVVTRRVKISLNSFISDYTTQRSVTFMNMPGHKRGIREKPRPRPLPNGASYVVDPSEPRHLYQSG